MTHTELVMPYSIADQTIDELGGRLSVLAAQRRDHIRLDRLLNELETSTGPAQEQVLHQIYRLVFPHAFAEESVLWPALRRTLCDGEELTLTVEREHQEVNELVSELESGELRHDRQELLAGLVSLLRQDVRDEEDVLLPRLQQTVSRRELRRLGLTWELVRRTAPTRPHPVVARRPPGNVIAALPLTVLDRSRDGLEALARRTPPTFSTRLRSTSQVLARAAGRVETIPVMRRGEDPSTHRRPAEDQQRVRPDLR